MKFMKQIIWRLGCNRKAVVQKRQILASHQNNRKSKAFWSWWSSWNTSSEPRQKDHGRVSKSLKLWPDQRSDLAAQAERLSHYGCQLVIKDLGSGLNCKKPGLKRLLRLLLLNRIGTMVLTHDDRLLRFVTELIYYIAHYMVTRVVILDEPEQQSFETELVKDVTSLMNLNSSLSKRNSSRTLLLLWLSSEHVSTEKDHGKIRLRKIRL